MNADDRFIQEHQALVRGLARKLRAQLDLNCELDDLVAFGFHGLVEARTRFDASRGVQFKTFAYYRIRGAILDGVRKMAYLPRRAYAQLRAAEAIDQTTEEAGQLRAGETSSRNDVESAASVLSDALQKITASYVLACVGQGEDDAPSAPDEPLIAAQERHRVNAALERLPERERTLVRAFYFEGRTLDDAAKSLGISKSWASRIHGKALELLRSALEDAS